MDASTANVIVCRPVENGINVNDLLIDSGRRVLPSLARVPLFPRERDPGSGLTRDAG